ncbi:JAK kinase, partial [Acromyrmex heyeri]
MDDDLRLSHYVYIYMANRDKPLKFAFTVGETIEYLCIKICHTFNISPLARHLFALQSYSSKLWFPCGHILEEDSEKYRFNFRLRFKPSSMDRLREIDLNAYNYYFEQVRKDVLDNKVPDIVYEKHKHELIGLGVSDMYRVMLEEELPREIVESEYKKYIPKECIKRHAFFIRKPIHNALTKLSGYDAAYVKEQYLKQFERMAPNYPYEEYTALMDKDIPNLRAKVLLRITIEQVKYCEIDIGTWKTICRIEDISTLSIGKNNTVLIGRRTGIPLCVQFDTKAILLSFVSALDGYYRLSVKWNFNLCSGDLSIITPSLERLQKLRCHGPVGKDFSYTKLKEKCANEPGSYILRESETEYCVYYIDVYNKDGTISSQEVVETKPDKFVMTNSSRVYESLRHLISSFQNPNESIYFGKCLGFSEYDKSKLLLCALENIVNEVAADEEIITTLLQGGPRCVPWNELQVYKAIAKSDEDLTCSTTMTSLHRAIWRVAKGKKLEVMMKILKTEENNYTKEFLELVGKWSQLRSVALVRLYGITVAPTIGMLLELVNLGPLDKYLCSNSKSVLTVDMVEATVCLATALWHLEENRVIHGNVRCRNVLVHSHTDNSFIVKLGDPGLFTYTEDDIYWIPPECYTDFASAKYSLQADIWALATTIWEIFSRGASPPKYHKTHTVKMYYKCGNRLPPPKDCPNEIYKLMLECWGKNNSIARKQPQAIMRDINQILYEVYNARRTHTYATICPKFFRDADGNNDENGSIYTEESKSNSESQTSLVTDYTNITWNDHTTEQLVSYQNQDSNIDELSFYLRWLNSELYKMPFAGNGNDCGPSCEDSSGKTNKSKTNDKACNSKDSAQWQRTYEINENLDVILQGRIGEGFYGEVYKGTLRRRNGKEVDSEQDVAVKKLKTQEDSENVLDFEREIKIMERLNHPNIVKILCSVDRILVMEFIQYGSLLSYLSSHRYSLAYKTLLGFALDIVAGMEYLGSMNIVHRDLAARNILVANEDRVKISDFGLAQVIAASDYYVFKTLRNIPIKWYAPESLRHNKFSTRSDVWSFGVTMYEVFSYGVDPQLSVRVAEKEILMTTITDLSNALERGHRLPCPDNCPQEIHRKLMLSCWQLNSHERPIFATLREDIEQLLCNY